jgi:TonB-linked SusC/RagA family outer membrane protein
MRKVMTLLCLLIGISWASAQTNVTGVVISADDGQPIIGASVVVKGTTHGTITDANGKFSLTVPSNEKTLIFSYVGMVKQELDAKPFMRVIMHSNAQQMNEVVVTAMGISREAKSLGYATQEVGGNTLNIAKPDNVINSLSGRVSGVDIKSSGNLGGSTNIVIRGDKSLMGNNQALFIVDGVPLTNQTSNSSYQSTGGQGYDYGSVVSDIDPNDIKSISVLKGAAATALYGSRAANGVIMITTKSGRDDKYLGKNGLGVSFSSNVTIGTIDRSTFPKYQNQYGAGYGPYYSGGGDGSLYPGLYYGPLPWTNGSNVYYVPTTEDASYGTKFDPNLMVYQWDAFVPESPNYQKATPWVAAKNGPITFFNTAVTTSNTLALNGASENSTFRFSYTNFRQNGILPNSTLTKNEFAFNASHKLTKNFTVSADANYVHQNTIGRNGTGYMGNIMTSFRQWWEVNVDMKELEALYKKTGRNVTWNMSDPANGNTSPIYWNNFYWERYNNYENDSRSHLFGNVQLKWDITSYLNIIGRVSLDTYTQLQEEHIAVGSVPAAFGIGLLDVPSGYSRNNINFNENNYDLLINFNKNLTSTLNLTALVGGNIRRNNQNSIYASTNGGMTIPGLNSIANSVSQPLAPLESQSAIGVNGIFGSVSLGFKNTYYVDATLRRDQSSTLPINNDSYYYPSISGSFIFSNLLKWNWLTFAKFRINYAEVGNDAPFASLFDTYTQPSPFGSVPLYSVNATENNPNLKSEKTKSSEAGLEMAFLNKRIGFDGDVYLTNTINQIMPVAVSPATGYSFKYVNSGEVRNQGIELNVYGTPVKTKNFNWDINVNWSINANKVVSLYEGVNNLQLGSFQGGVTIDASINHPYGLIEGTDYVYNNKGQKVIGSKGYYLITSTTNNVIGNSNPKWRGGVTNSFSYKNWTASFLIDVQSGGSVFSLDQYYGQSDGIYPMTVGNNDLGNPKRNTLANGGGIILPGVLADGTPNTKRINADRYTAYGYPHQPNSAFVYDASYVKLREAQISYNFESRSLEHIGIHTLSLGVVGSNLWIIFKNLPYADPESGLGAGNLQGWQGGVMPTTRNIGFNLKVQF